MKRQEAENLLLAMVGVYVWVASADAEADLDEYNKFNHVILESPFATHYTEEDMRHVYKDTVEMFRQDYEYGVKITLERVTAFKQNPVAAEEFLRLAEAAMVADRKLDQSEENVLETLKRELQGE